MDNVPVHISNNVGRRSQPKRLKFNLIKVLRTKATAIITGIILVLAIVIFSVLSFYGSTTGANITADKYQAVFFTNGQVYFGKLHTMNAGYVKLTDIFYLQAKDTTDTTKLQNASGQSEQGVELIKLGNEIHGPEDSMIINKDQILFFENLKPNGKVSQSIAQYKK